MINDPSIPKALSPYDWIFLSWLTAFVIWSLSSDWKREKKGRKKK